MARANLGSAYVELETRIGKFKAGLDQAESRLFKFANSAKAIGGTMMAIGIAATAAIAAMMRPFMHFERSMAAVKAVSGATGAEFDKLKQTAMEMGRTTIFTASQAADALYYLASAGFTVEQQIDSLGAVLSLAAATQSDLAESARITVAAISQFSLGLGGAQVVADTFTYTINNTQATLSKLGQSMSLAGPVAAAMGWSIKETTAVLGTFYNAGLDGSTAGTALRMMLIKLSKPTAEAAKVISRLNLQFYKMTPALVEATHAVDSSRVAVNRQRMEVERLTEEYRVLNSITQAFSDTQWETSRRLSRWSLVLMKLRQTQAEQEEKGIEVSEEHIKTMERVQNVLGRLAIREFEQALVTEDVRKATELQNRELKVAQEELSRLEGEYKKVLEFYTYLPKEIKNAEGVAKEFQKTLGNIADQARLVGVRAIVGTEALGKQVETLTSLIQGSQLAMGLAAETAAIQMDTLWGELKKTTSAAEGMAIIMGEELAPVVIEFLKEVIIPLIRRITEFAKTMTPTQKWFLKIAAVAGPVITLLGVLLLTFWMLFKVGVAVKTIFLAIGGALKFMGLLLGPITAGFAYNVLVVGKFIAGLLVLAKALAVVATGFAFFKIGGWLYKGLEWIASKIDWIGNKFEWLGRVAAETLMRLPTWMGGYGMTREEMRATRTIGLGGALGGAAAAARPALAPVTPPLSGIIEEIIGGVGGGGVQTTINANFDIEHLDPSVNIPEMLEQIELLHGAKSRLD